jgi:hypothetical protein
MVANPLWILGVTLGLTLSIASSDPSNARLHAQAEQIENSGLHLAEPMNKSCLIWENRLPLHGMYHA